MPTIKFEELLVDQPAFKNPGLLTANNCIPYARGYKPLPTIETFTDAITDRARGLFAARSTTDTIKVVAGDVGKLYMLDGATWDDVSKVGGYSLGSSDNWQFTIFGNNIIASTITENLQKFEIGTDTLFSDLTALKAKYVTVIGEFLVTAYNENQPQRVRWSALNDPTDFTVSQTTQSDFQDIVGDHGAIQGIVGGEYGIVFTEKAIHRMQYVGTPFIFQFDKVQAGFGAFVPGGITNYGRISYYLSEDGFYAFDGNKSIPIGSNKVNKFFFNDLSTTSSYIDRISATVDPSNDIVVWAYPSTNSTGELDKLIIYNYVLDRWSTADVDIQVLGFTKSASFTLEQIAAIDPNLDEIEISFDSIFWTGQQFQLAAFTSDKKTGVFTGTAGTATFVTGENNIEGDRRAIVRSVTPLIDGGTLTTKIGYRDKQGSAINFTSAVSPSDNGTCYFRQPGKYLRQQVDVVGNFDQAFGLELDVATEGKR